MARQWGLVFPGEFADPHELGVLFVGVAVLHFQAEELDFESFAHAVEGGIVVDVVLFGDVAAQVVEFPAWSGDILFGTFGVEPEAVVEDELKVLGPDAVVSGIIVMSHMHPVAVVAGLAPVLRGLSGFENGSDAAALHGVGNFDASKVE